MAGIISRFIDRDLRVTILGNTGTGKTTIIKRIKGVEPLETEKTTDILVEKKKIKLRSQEKGGIIERFRWYRVLAVDVPGDFSLRRKWRDAMRKYRSDGIIFMLDPTQEIVVQKTAMEDAYNYFMDSIDLKPERADKKAKMKKAIFAIVVNKIDLMEGNTIDEQKINAHKYVDNFYETLQVFRSTFPLAHFREAYLSALHGPYEDVDRVFEIIKLCLYPFG